MLLDGQEVMWVEPQGYIVLVAGATDDPRADQIYCTVRDNSVLVNEYTRAMASAPVLEAVGLHEEYHLLAEYNDVVLAGQEREDILRTVAERIEDSVDDLGERDRLVGFAG